MADAPSRQRVLILGGTAEARALAEQAVSRFGDTVEVVSSLAGRTRGAADLPGTVRVGGFGGADGLARYIADEDIACVVDATHPFAPVISAHAAEACGKAGVPRLALVRPPWPVPEGLVVRRVADLAGAARALAEAGAGRVFLTTGTRGLEAFSALAGTWFLVRQIERHEEAVPLARCTVVVGRPPFSVDGERELMAAHGIDALVTKESGGRATAAKLVAARELGVRVVMVTRPPAPPGERADTPERALRWISATLGLD